MAVMSLRDTREARKEPSRLDRGQDPIDMLHQLLVAVINDVVSGHPYEGPPLPVARKRLNSSSKSLSVSSRPNTSELILSQRKVKT